MAAPVSVRLALCRSSRRLTPAPCLRVQSAIPRPLNGRANASHSRCFSSSRTVREKRYTEAHEWIELAADRKTATLGISAYAAKALGDVTFVELPEPGLTVGAGDALAAVESVKSASDIYAPCAGTVTEANAALEDKPDIIGKDPEGADGWLARLEVAGPEEVERVEGLMDAAKYKTFTEETSDEGEAQ